MDMRENVLGCDDGWMRSKVDDVTFHSDYLQKNVFIQRLKAGEHVFFDLLILVYHI